VITAFIKVSSVIYLLTFAMKRSDVGIIPGCPDGYFKSAALCYEHCKDGYAHVLGVCWE
jgi:hypothetical protein